MTTEPTHSPVRRIASAVYDAQAGGRHPMLDGPWWLGLSIAAVLAVLVLGSAPWTWIALSVAAVLIWLPLCAHWGVALVRSARAFREESRS